MIEEERYLSCYACDYSNRAGKDDHFVEFTYGFEDYTACKTCLNEKISSDCEPCEKNARELRDFYAKRDQ